MEHFSECTCSMFGCSYYEKVLSLAPCPPPFFYSEFAEYALRKGLCRQEVCKMAERCMGVFPLKDSHEITQNICSPTTTMSTLPVSPSIFTNISTGPTTVPTPTSGCNVVCLIFLLFLLAALVIIIILVVKFKQNIIYLLGVIVFCCAYTDCTEEIRGCCRRGISCIRRCHCIYQMVDYFRHLRSGVDDKILNTELERSESGIYYDNSIHSVSTAATRTPEMKEYTGNDESEPEQTKVFIENRTSNNEFGIITVLDEKITLEATKTDEISVVVGTGKGFGSTGTVLSNTLGETDTDVILVHTDSKNVDVTDEVDEGFETMPSTIEETHKNEELRDVEISDDEINSDFSDEEEIRENEHACRKDFSDVLL